MAGMSNVDSDKILSTVGQLEGITDRLNGCVTKFSDAIAALDKGWVSEVKGPFMDNYQTDLEAMQEMVSQLQEVNAIMREAAADFDKTESEIAGNVRALN